MAKGTTYDWSPIATGTIFGYISPEISKLRKVFLPAQEKSIEVAKSILIARG